VLTSDQLRVEIDPASIFNEVTSKNPRQMSIAELQAQIARNEQQKPEPISTHNEKMEIQKRFAIPVACLVFALIGLAVGVSNRRDGKLASFVLGIAVIFIYYVAMFTSGAMTKGALMPAWLAMWVPNILLAVAGVVLISLRSRGMEQAQLRLPSLPWLRARFGADADAPGGATGPGHGTPARRRGTVIVIRVPQFQLPRPNLLDLYIARTYVRMLVLCIVGLMGVFYISTFIDLSDKLFKGQVSLSMILSYLWWATPQFLYYIIAIAALLAAIVTIGLLTKNS
jgi:lipopolysaccharide export LptBFGC system permease protein LptF